MTFLPRDLRTAFSGAAELVISASSATFFIAGVGDPELEAQMTRMNLSALVEVHNRAREAILKVTGDHLDTRKNRGPARFGQLDGATAHEVTLGFSQEIDTRVRSAVMRASADILRESGPAVLPELKRYIANWNAAPDLDFLQRHFQAWRRYFDRTGLPSAAEIIADLKIEAAAAARGRIGPTHLSLGTSPKEWRSGHGHRGNLVEVARSVGEQLTRGTPPTELAQSAGSPNRMATNQDELGRRDEDLSNEGRTDPARAKREVTRRHFAIGVDAEGRWQHFRFHDRRWRHFGRLNVRGRKSKQHALLELFLEYQGRLSEDDAVKLWRDPESMRQATLDKLEPELSNLRKAIRKARGVGNDTSDPLPRGTVDGTRCWITELHFGHVGREDVPCGDHLDTSLRFFPAQDNGAEGKLDA
jgi:hypothetical protein